jgi:guanylate kinase
LLEELVKAGCERIVSTTDREPRVGEIQGVHYDFINTTVSKFMEAHGRFAELVTYNGVRYGVTHDEMEFKMIGSEKPPIVILEPKGVEIYRKYCTSKGWQMYTVYVETVEHIRLERLIDRTASNIWEMHTMTYNDLRAVIAANNKRLKAILDEERAWGSTNRWDCIVDGTNVTKAMDTIRRGIEWRNSRPEMYA